ncbi:hypothetical protein HYDPIDRAFT_85336 [Hydnomerulius pinastri MD-312]|nr:hypothetical protein HYDPIDRAFT_85336 [Hydnomerulius pinastri MD-312]
MIAVLALLISAFVVAIDIIRRQIRSKAERRGLSLPPGPPELPWLGNILSIDAEEPWHKYTEWGATYDSDILYIRILDQDVIILNSQSDAVELLEKRSQIYSDRPYLATVKPFGWDNIIGLIPYGEHWRLCRRIFHQTFRAESALTFRPMQLRRAREIVANLLQNANDYQSHFETFAAAVVMSAIYGYETRPHDDPMVHISDRFVSSSIEAISPEKAAILKAFPFLLHLPGWVPGSYKSKSLHALKSAKAMVEIPYQYARNQMEVEVDQPFKSMVSDHIARMHKYDESYRAEYEGALKKASATAFVAAVETTSASLMVFTLVMVSNPHIWKHAQAEIDAVVGTDRFPEYSDRLSLPYVEAIVRETQRWLPVLPLGIAHATVSSDVYKGFFIPKGATIISNTWAMSRDETRYQNASQFVPERFLTSEGTLNDDDPAKRYAFGFGRRICPGRHTADASLWAGIVTMLAALEFSHVKDAEGKDIPITPSFVNGLNQ